jgi:hypothetical protein
VKLIFKGLPLRRSYAAFFAIVSILCVPAFAQKADKKEVSEKIKLEGNSASDLLFKLQADKRTKTLQSSTNMTHVKLGPIECLRVGSHGGAVMAITTTCLITP